MPNSDGITYWFQSPSRRGRRYNRPRSPTVVSDYCVSVPFAKGTPLQPDEQSATQDANNCFSPLREGDAATTRGRFLTGAGHSAFQSPSRRGRRYNLRHRLPDEPLVKRFSPLREGDAATTIGIHTPGVIELTVSVPFAKGTPLQQAGRHGAPSSRPRFQSPSRRGRRYNAVPMMAACRLCPVSVPFAKGTPLQLRLRSRFGENVRSFSPLREGDAATTLPSSRTRLVKCCVSVPFAKGTPLQRGVCN